MTDAPQSTDNNTLRDIWLRRLDWICPLLLVTVPMVAGLIFILLQSSSHDFFSVFEPEGVGRPLLNSLYYYIGAAGMFYMVNPGRSEQWARILIWGVIQLGSA
ncbi:MAG: hypothetical protein IKW19_00180, partial [Akkermansia sp.]|nr:hypothetical protein [Akkermansia sp.]